VSRKFCSALTLLTIASSGIAQALPTAAPTRPEVTAVSGVRPFRLYDLRHTFATRAPWRARRLGHAAGTTRPLPNTDGPTLRAPDRRTSGLRNETPGRVQCGEANGRVQTDSVSARSIDSADIGATRFPTTLAGTPRLPNALKTLKRLEARVGIEPTHKGFADLSLTTWVPRLAGY